MCIGMANGGKEPEFISQNILIGDLGRMYIPKEMLEKLNIEKGDELQLTATGNIIVIEKCEFKNCEIKINESESDAAMTISEFADGLNGREYGKEITPLEERRAADLDFVIVFGYSDDCAEFRGAIEDERDCFDGGRVFEENGKYIDAVWCEGEYSWSYNTNIPHATFDIYDDGDKYCKGIIFQRSDTDEQNDR